MASADSDEKNAYIFDWNIENFSFFGFKTQEAIVSPVFEVDTLGKMKTKLKLKLYLRGSFDIDFVKSWLKWVDRCDDVDTLKLNFTLQFLASNGSVLVSKLYEQTESSKARNFFPTLMLPCSDVFRVKRNEFLSENTLIVRCTLFKIGDKFIEPGRCVVRTSVDVHCRAFVWTVEDFTAYIPDQKSNFTVKSISNEDLIFLELYIPASQGTHGIVNIDITVKTQNIKFLAFMVRVLNFPEIKVQCVTQEFSCGEVGKIGTCTLVLPKREVIAYEGDDVLYDDLLLQGECAYSTGKFSEKIEPFRAGFTLDPRTSNAFAHNKTVLPRNHLVGYSVSLADDLQGLYDDGILCDTKLCTKTETFRAHRVVLSARSPVFRAMFTVDMKEKATECVNIPDVDADTVRQMLRYMYTDRVEDLNWESACLLYEVADKYDILSLKNKCSYFLQRSLSQAKACEVLVLADLHQDKDLKMAVQDYILKQNEIVFRSKEWKSFVEKNPKLAAETMLHNWQKD